MNGSYNDFNGKKDLLDIYHYNFRCLEIRHYNSSIKKYMLLQLLHTLNHVIIYVFVSLGNLGPTQKPLYFGMVQNTPTVSLSPLVCHVGPMSSA
jgi:hypothetical protein